MHCPYCGEKLPEGARFCSACGSSLADVIEVTREESEEISEASVSTNEGAVVPASRRKLVLPMILIAVVIATIVVVNVVIAMMSTEEERWKEQYDLGQQYLLELNYEQAIVAFTAAIEIDANNAEAYIGRAEAYLAADASSSETKAEASETEATQVVVLSDYQNAALADYLYAITLDDTREDAYISAAELYLLAEEEDQAIELLSSYPIGEDDVSEKIDALLKTLLIQNEKESLLIQFSSSQGFSELMEYDAYGNMLRGDCYEDDTFIYYSVSFYDESGNEVLWMCYDSDGTLSNWALSLYDSEGNKTEYTEYYADGTTYAHHEYEYDSEGNNIVSLEYNESGVSRTEYVYVDGNRTASYSYDEDGNLESYVIYETDDEGKTSSYTSYYADGTVYKWGEYEYVYDEDGYLIRRIVKDSYEYSNGTYSVSFVSEYSVVEVLSWGEDAAEAGREEGYVLTEEEITAVINGEWLP